MKIALLCGGPSLERGISLNSARSVCDHLHSDDIEMIPIYFDHFKKPYKISRAQLYSNTPSDFDFKLKQNSKPLTSAAFKRILKTVDLAFPVMHGSFGEDGQIQKILEKYGCPYVGSPVKACQIAFNKHRANQFIRKQGFFTLPSIELIAHHTDHKQNIDQFFKEHDIKRAIIKPATGGSSIGVYSVGAPKEALEKAQSLFSKRVDTKVVIEPFCEGIEFTIIILENRFNMPVALLPTEIEISYEDHQVFDYRKKYLATRQVKYHCPPRFSDDILEKIQTQAEQLFKLLGMRDFARFDGWLLPDGNIWFSDFNPISGMEQNSFLFLQAAQIGMSHSDLLRFIIKNAAKRYMKETFHCHPEHSLRHPEQLINILFGGKTAERQVSLMSGTNVWLKLRNSKKFRPSPYLLDTKHNIWRLPYHMTLNHTVEEIQEMCENASKNEKRLHHLKKIVIQKLSPEPGQISEKLFLPEKMTLKQFIHQSDFVFIGLHGGIGEDGTLQKMFETAKIPFNGTGSKASHLCMNKYKTGKVIEKLKKEGIYSANKRLEDIGRLKGMTASGYRQYWKDLVIELGSRSIIVKPKGDGCSAGIARLYSALDMAKYIKYVNKADIIPDKTLKDQHGIIEMPHCSLKEIMFEQFIETDKIRVIENRLKWKVRSEWIEITMGIIEDKGKLKAMDPSLTVAVGNILTLEEKFQGGTGVNITPPPQPFVKLSAIKKAKARMEKTAVSLGIKGYARIDAFMHTKTGELIIIEANTTPGLTPSTVIYHQALTENPPMYPTRFLEKIVKNGNQK